MAQPPPGPANREGFVEHCFVTIMVHVIRKMPRRWSADPDSTARMVYDAITLGNIKLPITRDAFCTIVAPELASLFCNWERGHRPDARVMANVVFDGLEKAEVVPVIGEPTPWH